VGALTGAVVAATGGAGAAMFGTGLVAKVSIGAITSGVQGGMSTLMSTGSWERAWEQATIDAFTGAVGELVPGGKRLVTKMMFAAAENALEQGINIAGGTQDQFSWRSMGMSAGMAGAGHFGSQMAPRPRPGAGVAMAAVHSAGLSRKTSISPQLQERLAAYKGWKGRAGISGVPTNARFRDFVRGNTGNNGGGFYAPSNRARFQEHLSRVRASQKIQNHHLIPWENRTYPHASHRLVRQAGVDLRTYRPNIRPLAGHSGPHAAKYHLDVEERLDLGYEAVKGKGRAAARAELNAILDEIWADIGKRKLEPYEGRSVSIPP
jgi:hypothetical protein